jgi:ABC-2 type transport system permease protein
MSAIRVEPEWTSRLRVTQPRVILSEWTKLRSLRSTRWSMFVAVLLAIVLPLLGATITGSHWSHMSASDRAGRHPLDIALLGVRVAQLAIGVLGVLVFSGEYSTGMIRATLGAVPKRLPVLWGKVVVFATVCFLLMLPCVLIAFFGSQVILEQHHILQISFSASGVARSVIGGAVYLPVVGIFALAMGAITRNTAGGIAVFAGIFFVIPPLMNILPTSWNDSISKYLPSNAGADVFSLTHGPHDLGPAAGLGLFCAYTAAAIAVAAVLLLRRDA